MRNTKAADIVKKAEHIKEIDDNDITRKKKYINIAIEYIIQIYKENPGISPQELKYKVLNEINKENEEYCSIANVRGIYFELEAMWKLLKDKSIIQEKYDLIKKEEKYRGTEENPENIVYDSKHSRSCKNVVKRALFILKEMKKDMHPDWKELAEKYYKADDKEKKKIEKSIGTKQVINLKRIVKMLYSSNVEGIYEIINQSIETAENELKERQIKVMDFISNKFKRHNLLQRYKKDNDRNMSKCGLSGYTYPLTEEVDSIGIENAFSREFLEKQELEDVIMFSIFWQNRYSKECEGIGEAIFAIDTLNLWKDIQDAKKINISDEELAGISNKILCLKELAATVLKSVQSKSKGVTAEEAKEGYVKITSTAEIEQISKQEEKNYKRIFDEQTILSSNNLYDDLTTYKVILNLIENIYIVRNSILSSRLRTLTESKKCKNWGIIEEEFDKKYSKNGKESEYVLVGIDHEGFNMPIRLHIKKKLLTEMIKTYNGDTKVPIYEGDKDFIINNELLPTNILMPIQKKQRQVILKKQKELNTQDKDIIYLIEHLRFLRDQDKYPEHLKEKINSSKGVKSVRPPKKYKDLDTGEIFLRENNGEYILFDNLGGIDIDGR